MWMTWPPAASTRAAAAITSITMKGGTSLRADGTSRRRAVSSINTSPDIPAGYAASLAPQSAGFSLIRGAAERMWRPLTPAARVPSLRRNSDLGFRMAGETLSRTRGVMPASRAVAIATAMSLVLSSQPALSQPRGGGPNGGLPVIRDAEIEQLMRDYTDPVLKAAGLAQQNVQVVLINERAFNAFVMDGRRIFINVGALYDAKTPNEIIGVLAHETGHMAGGHLSRLREQLANAQTASIIAMLLGVGAMVGGATAGGAAGGNMGQVGPALLQGPQEMIRRTMLSYIRAQEEAADRAGVKFLNATQQSAKGMYLTFKRFADDQLVVSSRIDPYQQTHPMPRRSP